MWLKRTRVSTARGPRHYLQIVKSYNDGGRIRHKVVASLGREERVDTQAAKALVRSLNSSMLDSLPPEQLALLPSRAYGSIILLLRAYVLTGMHRFFTDLDTYNQKFSDLANGVFFTAAYPILNDDPALPFLRWVEGQHLPWDRAPSLQSLRSAVQVLGSPEVIHKALDSIPGPRLPWRERRLHFVGPLRFLQAGDGPGELLVDVTTDTRFYPRRMLRIPGHARAVEPEGVVVCDSRYVERRRLPAHRLYLYKLNRGTLPDWLPDCHTEAQRLLEEEGVYLPWSGGGYRELHPAAGGHRLLAIRPRPGVAPALDRAGGEPRELLLTNLPDSGEAVCEAMGHCELLLESLCRFVFPPELAGIPARERPQPADLLINTAHIKLLLAHEIESRVSSHTATMDEIIDAVRGIRATEICDGSIKRLYHTEFSEQQSRIMQAMSFNNHPRYSL